MSTRSPASSLVTALTREPRTPTQVPIGSTRLSCETHGDLGARAGVAGAALDLEQALLDLGHFLAEQLDHEARARARDSMICAPRRVGSTSSDEGAHAVAGAQVFLRDHLAAPQPAFDTARLDDDVALVEALDRADEDLLAARQEVVEQLLALGVADLLQDHLLGGLRADAADRHRLDRLLDVVVDLDVGDLFLGFEQQDLGIGICSPASFGTTCQRRKVS